MRIDYLTVLKCGHSQLYRMLPEPGDPVLCRRCNTYRTVTNHIPQWHFRCISKDCPHARSFGTDESECRAAAYGHAVRRNHTVMVRYGPDDKGEVKAEGLLALFDANRAHQQLLRRNV